MSSIRHTLWAMLLALPLLAGATTLKIATIAPDGTSWMTLMRAGADAIAERSMGRVKVRFYPGGIMGNHKSVMRKIKVGQLHGGATSLGMLGDLYTGASIYALPFTFRSLDEVDYVRSKMDKVIEQGLYASGFVSFGLSEGGFAYLMSREPVTSIADLKRSKVWLPEGDQIDYAAFAEYGITPIPLPVTDVLTGLQTGLIDTISNSAVGAIALQWHSKVRYLTDTPLIYLTGTLLIERATFEGLEPTDQTIVREEMGKVFSELNRVNRQDNASALAALVGQGIETVYPTEADVLEWRLGSARAMDQLSREGILSSELLSTLRRHLSDYRTTHVAVK